MTDDLSRTVRLNGFRDVLFRYNAATASHRAEPTADTMDQVQNASRHLIGMYEHALQGTPLAQVLREVEAERCAQVAKGYDAVHDDGHGSGEIGLAAVLYAMPPGASLTVKDADVSTLNKAVEIRGEGAANLMSDGRRRLIIAAALVIAEIERLGRAAGRAA